MSAASALIEMSAERGGATPRPLSSRKIHVDSAALTHRPCVNLRLETRVLRPFFAQVGMEDACVFWCVPALHNSTPFGVQLRYANHEIHSGTSVGVDKSADSHRT